MCMHMHTATYLSLSLSLSIYIYIYLNHIRYIAHNGAFKFFKWLSNPIRHFVSQRSVYQVTFTDEIMLPHVSMHVSHTHSYMQLHYFCTHLLQRIIYARRWLWPWWKETIIHLHMCICTCILPLGFLAFGIQCLINSTARAGAGAVLLWLPRCSLEELIPVRANPPFFDSIISIPDTGLSLPKVWHENHLFAAVSWHV